MGCHPGASGNASELIDKDKDRPKPIPKEQATQIVMDLVNYFDSPCILEMFRNALMNLQLNPESWTKEVTRMHDNFIEHGTVPLELVSLHRKLRLGREILAVE